jgi:hypothetical protein
MELKNRRILVEFGTFSARMWDEQKASVMKLNSFWLGMCFLLCYRMKIFSPFDLLTLVS